MAEFDVGRRERVLALLRVGLSVEEAAADAGVNTATVWRWRARGRAPGASVEAASFAERFDQVRAEVEGEARASSEAEDLDRLEREDEEDPFCQLGGDALGEAWRARVARREGKPPPEPVLPPSRDEAWAAHQARLARQAEATGDWPSEEDE